MSMPSFEIVAVNTNNSQVGIIPDYITSISGYGGSNGQVPTYLIKLSNNSYYDTNRDLTPLLDNSDMFFLTSSTSKEYVNIKNVASYLINRNNNFTILCLYMVGTNQQITVTDESLIKIIVGKLRLGSSDLMKIPNPSQEETPKPPSTPNPPLSAYENLESPGKTEVPNTAKSTLKK